MYCFYPFEIRRTFAPEINFKFFRKWKKVILQQTIVA